MTSLIDREGRELVRSTRHFAIDFERLVPLSYSSGSSALFSFGILEFFKILLTSSVTSTSFLS